jgi:hypothetical protein
MSASLSARKVYGKKVSSIVLKIYLAESSYSFCSRDLDVINYDVFYKLKPLNCRSYNTLALVHSVAFIFVFYSRSCFFISLF